MYRLAVPGLLPPFTVIHLEMTDGKLMLRTIARKVGKLSLVLRPISETESTILGLGRFGGEVVERIDQNGIQKLRMFGLELEKQ
jgi:hypothetical protein